jgi:hypothetical protein
VVTLAATTTTMGTAWLGTELESRVGFEERAEGAKEALEVGNRVALSMTFWKGPGAEVRAASPYRTTQQITPHSRSPGMSPAASPAHLIATAFGDHAPYGCSTQPTGRWRHAVARKDGRPPMRGRRPSHWPVPAPCLR